MRTLNESKQEALIFNLQFRMLTTLRNRYLLCNYLTNEMHIIDKY